MLERVYLHQNRFRTPGIAPDARGVVLGESGVVLFGSVDRLVAFLRAYGQEGSLDDLVPTLRIRRVLTPLKTRELLLTVAAESSYRMDRIAGIAKLVGGLVFTGTGRHFVRYRDSASPLGYDVMELHNEMADVVLYDQSFQQVYAFEQELPLRDLLYKLGPERRPEVAPEDRSALWATAEVGVGRALLSYLFRWNVDARAALAEWPPKSAFDDAQERLYIFQMNNVPARIVGLLSSLPGVRVFEPVVNGPAFVATELGFEHPIALDSCASVFEDEALLLFEGAGSVREVNPMPPFAPVRSLVRSQVQLASEEGALRIDEGQPAPSLGLSLRMVPSTRPWQKVTATMVPKAQRGWLSRLLYVLPPAHLAALRIAETDHDYVLIDPLGIDGLPLGVFYSEVASRIYVPSGQQLVPAISSSVLSELLRARGDGFAFFPVTARSEEATPLYLAASAFGPLSRRAIQALSGDPLDARAPAIEEPPLPIVDYEKSRRFPLWGIPKARRVVESDPEASGDAPDGG